ncbi:PP2C family protein-serine/threonine phosphatase [Pseudomarimonas arenosa]|uniref:SpoIIE family protein phosphatase n=1 Tax=Pseudomarimonas arenosa TaxID=2774145 RepID=A0AAW3ZDT0_9GAMM|nr:SpoIIE family protein phosphatase [Pseudomarimonas arenosa]MBD8524343.1 SpoIIE family protein phosphatase [Pseudomarimonas arenosa]
MSAQAADELLFLDDEAPAVFAESWNVLIVDDEPEMHAITRLALRDLSFRGRGLNFLSAHSGREAEAVLRSQDDIALILLDVVMETDDAGLKVARFVRETLHNDRVRIVLRTGQPGQAPERNVIVEYDINDYKEKTELTSQKLVTTVISSLRTYQAISEVAALNRELEAKVRQRTEELEQSNHRLRRSLDALEQGEQAGRRIQFKLLPAKQKRFANYRFSHVLMASEVMSGDFVDYFAIDEHRVLFYIADVAGHGVASAFVTVYLKRFMGSVLEGGGAEAELSDPALMLSRLNIELLRDRLGKHIALFVGVLDTQSDQLVYANAGAFPFPLVDTGGSTTFLEQKSMPVGLMNSTRYESGRIALSPASRLLLVSDGLLELMADANTDRKLDSLRRRFVECGDDADSLLSDWMSLEESALPDDLTVLMLSGVRS